MVLPIDRVVELVDQHIVGVRSQEFVPLGAPQHLDDVPSSTTEDTLKFFDDSTIAADGTIEALQVAIDDPGQIVETSAASQ